MSEPPDREPEPAPDAAPDREPEPAPDPAPDRAPEPALDAAPDREPGPAPDAAPVARSRRRWIGLAAVAAVAVVAAIVGGVANRGGRAASPSPGSARRDGGVALRAPVPPHVPGVTAGGVRLTGVVVDGTGGAVTGAEVSAEPERGAVDRALAGTARDAGADPSPSDAGAAAAPAVAIAAPTGGDGRFAIDGLAAGRYRVRVTGPGLLAAELRFVPVPSDEARVVVARQVVVEGTVSDGGQPVAGAQVGVRGDAIGGTLELKTDARGGFRAGNLPEGRYQVFAWRGALAARAVRVSRLGAGPFGAVELRLEAAAIVVGRVVDRGDGSGVVAAIELRPSGDDQAPRYARSGDDGVFRIEGVPTGRWIADAFAPGFLSPGGVELDAGRGTPELQLARGGAIEGRVVDGDGQPIAGAEVRAIAPSTTTGAPGAEASAQVDADKLRRFSGRTTAPAPIAGVPGSDPELLARGELGVLVGPIPPIPPPGALARPAAVVDASAGLVGEPPPLPVDPKLPSIWITGSDGRYRVAGLARGKVTVLARAAGLAEARSKPIAIAPGELIAGVDLVLSPGTFVFGKVTDQRGAPVVGAELVARPELGVPASGFSDAAGEYRLGPLAGAIELRASAYGHVAVRRALELGAPRGRTPAERREDVVLEVADATLAGTLDDEAGAPVVGAHLEVADGVGEGRHAIVGADGTFAIEMLPAGALKVRVEHARYPTQIVDAVASTRAERVRLRIALGGAVEGALLDNASGAPLASVVLVARGPEGATAEASTDKAGRWKLGPLRVGRWTINVRLPGYMPATRELDVPAAREPGGASVRDVRIDLARGALVGGTVRDARGQRVQAAHVVARGDAGDVVEADTDTLGEFRLRDCPAGELVVTATKGDATGSVRATVRAGAEVLGLAIEVR